jgi:hypothetical protein
MTTYFARIMDAQTGSDASYEFNGPPDLMSRTGDEIVSVFFDEVDEEVLRDHIDWELNAVLNNRERRVVTAIGSLIPEKNDPPIPFLLMISDHDSEDAVRPSMVHGD